MRMSDSSRQGAVMSQLVNWRSLSVPGFRSNCSKPGLPAPIFARISFQRPVPTDFGSPNDMLDANPTSRCASSSTGFGRAQ